MWPMELNRKGRDGITVSGEIEFSGARLTRFRSSAPNTVSSSVSRSEPSWPPAKIFTDSRPPVRSATMSAIARTPCTVG